MGLAIVSRATYILIKYKYYYILEPSINHQYRENDMDLRHYKGVSGNISGNIVHSLGTT